MVEPQLKIRKLHNIRSSDICANATQHDWIDYDQSTAVTAHHNEAYGHGSSCSTLFVNTNLNVLVGLMANHLPMEFEEYKWPGVLVAVRKEEATAEASQCAPGSSEPNTVIASSPIFNAPPRRFYRTFWRAMAKRALMRAG